MIIIIIIIMDQVGVSHQHAAVVRHTSTCTCLIMEGWSFCVLDEQVPLSEQSEVQSYTACKSTVAVWL